MGTVQEVEVRAGDELKLSKNELQRLLKAEGSKARQEELSEKQLSQTTGNRVAAETQVSVPEAVVKPLTR